MREWFAQRGGKLFPHVAHVFIDGGYLRKIGDDLSVPFPDPSALAQGMVDTPTVQSWASDPTRRTNALLGRIMYYDAIPDGGVDPNLDEYWRTIELQPDMHLGFGALRGLKRKARQKGVDVQIAVDMLERSSLFDIAILVAGDADFVPVVEAVNRRGIMVVVAAELNSLADDLRRVADRYVQITKESKMLRSLPITATVRLP